MYVDWGTKIIHVPKSDLTLVQSVPTEIRQLDLNWFRLTLKDLEDDDIGMPYSNTHNHNTEVSVGGVDLARVIEILDPYTVTFEDGQYAVNLFGANSNVGDKVNVNQVSVRSANSAGLVNSQAIEFGEFNGVVTIDTVNGVSGTIYPAGTLRQPSNNIQDAIQIATYRGFDTFVFLGNLTLTTGDNISGYTIRSTNPVTSILNIEDGATVINSYIRDCYFTGFLDGGCILRDCILGMVQYFSGYIEHCALTDNTIYVNGQAVLTDCFASANCLTTPPVLDLTGTLGLAIRNYSGSLISVNKTSTANCEIGLDGIFTIDSTVVDGTFTIYGDGYVINNGTGDSLLVDRTTGSPQEVAMAVWNSYMNSYTTEGTFGNEVAHLRYVSHQVYLNTEAAPGGDGSQHLPFNDLSIAIDFCEEHGFYDLVILADIQLDRQLKNFRVTGVGNPTVDTFGQILTKTEFFHCNMEGDYIGSITVQQGVLLNGFTLNGYFEKCALAGDLVASINSYIIIAGCFSGIAGTGRPTISMNSGGPSDISIRDYTGGLTINDCDHIDDVITVDGRGGLTFGSSCVAGEMVARGRWEPFVNLTTGATVHEPVGDQVKVDDIYATQMLKRHKDELNNTITIYEDDNATPRNVFDYTDNANGEVITITPQ